MRGNKLRFPCTLDAPTARHNLFSHAQIGSVNSWHVEYIHNGSQPHDYESFYLIIKFGDKYHITNLLDDDSLKWET